MNIGDKFGKLTVVSEKFQKKKGSGVYFVNCTCDCGSDEKAYRCSSLKKRENPTRSCGCLRFTFVSAVGGVYERLTVVEDVGVVGRDRFVICNCSCGTTGFRTRLRLLTTGDTKSCGCLQQELRDSRKRHMLTGSPTYISWQAMKTRCRNENSDNYENYGGRGITYDPSWEVFDNFLEDMGLRPEGMTLDRIDVNGNYCKENCCWSSKTEQVFNRRKQQGTSSDYIGVSKPKGSCYWVACLSKNGKRLFREKFLSEEDAVNAYNEACLEYYGYIKNLK